MVLNAVPPLGKVGEEARRALEDGGVEVAAPVLHQLVAFSHAVNDGRTAQELDPESKAAAEIDALFAWVKKHANAQTAFAGKHKNTQTGLTVRCKRHQGCEQTQLKRPNDEFAKQTGYRKRIANDTNDTNEQRNINDQRCKHV